MINLIDTNEYNLIIFSCSGAGPLQPCASKPCKNGGSCSEQGKGYKCQCTDKFTGDKCETEIGNNRGL